MYELVEKGYGVTEFHFWPVVTGYSRSDVSMSVHTILKKNTHKKW
jgi:hypothetical protein